ncbi:MAG TPA: hypothetical protein VGI03_12660 [Verrucomicrobiae bacterium]|jgi:hypothetical protein
MDFIKKNYEKIILSIVLLGLVGVAGFLPVLIASDHQAMEAMRQTLTHPKVNPLQDLDTSNQDAVLLRLKDTTPLDFSTTNRLFNPVTWQKDKNGILIKIVTGNEVGAGAAVIAKITPLYFQVSLDSVITNEAAPRYEVAVEDQASQIPAQRRPQHHYLSVGESSGILKLIGVKGPANNPTELDLVVTDTGEAAVVTPENPFRRVDGHTADLKYPPENFNANNVRVGAMLDFNSDQYNIIAIDSNDVILLQQSNQKKFVLPYTP